MIRTPRPPATDVRLRSLMSPYVGVVNAVYDKMHLPDDARLSYIFCKAARSNGLLDGGRDVAFDGNGAHFTRDGAIASAIGEAVERYCGAAAPPLSSTRLGAFTDLDVPAVPPSDFSLYHPSQYARDWFTFVPFENQTVVRWARGNRLGDNAERYVPVQLSYLQDLPGDDEERIGYNTSSGLACGATREDAILSGLLEVIERDAFMLTWYHRCSLPRITFANDPALREMERRYFTPAGLTHHVIDMSAFLGIPAALAVVWNDRDPSGVVFACGAAAATSMRRAVTKSLVEAYHCRAWARDLRNNDRDRQFAEDFSDVRGFNDHVSLYARPDYADKAAFLFASTATRDVGDYPSIDGASAGECAEDIAARLAAQGIDTYQIDQTTPDIKSAGLHVVRIVAPQAVKLNSTHRSAFLGGPRLYEAPVRAGLASEPLSLDDLNPLPHPFP